MDLAGYKPTLSEVAGLVGKSSRWIAELRANGALPPDGATLGEFVEAWAKHNGGTVKGKGIDAASTRLVTAQADMAEMKAAQLRLELLPRGDVIKSVQAAFSRVRGKLLGLPARSAPIIVSIKSVVAIQEKLTELVHEALAELSETTIIADEAAAAGSGDDGGTAIDASNGSAVVPGDAPAAKADRKSVGRRKPAAKPRGKRRTG